MSVIAKRKIAAIIGAACADAAGQPLHWIYNREKLDQLLDGKEEIEFSPTSHNPFYNIETGKNTCYGDQAFVVLESLVECKGVDLKDQIERTKKRFGPDSDYAGKYVYDPAWKTIGTPKDKLPLAGPWKHASIKEFLANVEQGKSVTGSVKDEQIDGVTKVAPLVALYAGRAEMLERVEDVVRVTQNDDLAVAMALVAARILEHFILNGPDSDMMETVLKQLQDPNRNNPQELDTAVIGFLRQVVAVTDKPHKQVVQDVFVNS